MPVFIEENCCTFPCLLPKQKRLRNWAVITSDTSASLASQSLLSPLLPSPCSGLSPPAAWNLLREAAPPRWPAVSAHRCCRVEGFALEVPGASALHWPRLQESKEEAMWRPGRRADPVEQQMQRLGGSSGQVRARAQAVWPEQSGGRHAGGSEEPPRTSVRSWLFPGTR